ncbi:hypothetical protein IV38_GL000791 [Lactobacillus selangorensis]|uniref:Uncharacterized protein n=1 Tax=Lactobacillus selangorensis TaxID=81857 RepID=A0A0R2FJ66_9LACO|nr:hypothetical protein [Lactobacillus selangorensis]KRN28592.1 hypothetical protein IV38_GL000791 [Lactobacillus selangorensis]KRN32998.1 hypothetical protein IV40_GL001062 [Lactobacillus selangorensis]
MNPETATIDDFHHFNDELKLFTPDVIHYHFDDGWKNFTLEELFQPENQAYKVTYLTNYLKNEHADTNQNLF